MLISQFAPSLFNIKGPGWDQYSSTQNLIFNTEAYKFCKKKPKKLVQLTMKTISLLFFCSFFYNSSQQEY